MNINDKYKLLLEFLEMVADELIYEKFENLNELNWYAFDLLQKINNKQ